MASAISLICAAIIWFWVTSILSTFTHDANLLATASTFLKIQIVSYLVWGLVVALSMVLNGVGSTWIPMLTNLFTMLGVQLGLAYFLPRYTSLGVDGVRWAIVAGIVIRAVIYPLYFRTGRWKWKKV
jgi:Na+-driven multidrug efflux pump